MAQDFSISINDKALRITLSNLNERLQNFSPMLRIVGNVMRGSFERTFRDQGSPAGSWAPLAASTLKRGKGGSGRKILIQSGRLKNSITYQEDGNTLRMGSNLVYSAIHQFGGVAGRRAPSNRRKLSHLIDQQVGGAHGPMKWRRPIIPARPYLVFHPEDPQRITDALERYIAAEGAK
jgi:phage virion morphogenesis protein